MGDIILFRADPSPQRKLQGENPSTGARILFFTGVRYQRASEYIPVTQPRDPDDPSVGAARKRRRRA